MKRVRWKSTIPWVFSATLFVSLASCSDRSPPTAFNPFPPTPAPPVQPAASSASPQQAVAPEQNPAGDIPDSQVFITYRSAGNYQLEVPEGWARQIQQSDVSFVEKFDGVQVAVSTATAAPTVQSIEAEQISLLEKSNRSVKINSAREVQLPAGRAILIDYTSNSEPDAVTGKQVRLENNSYFFYHNGKLATLRLYAPQGTDNVDQWQRMSNSFQWL